MKKGILFILFCSSSILFAQEAQQEINTQVWKPFVEHFNNRNADGFLAVHSRDVVRAPRDSKTIFGWNEYLKQQQVGNERGKASGRKSSLELRFTERIAKDNLAIEVGVYKTTSTDKEGNSHLFFGRFHVVLRKEQGVWKILVDTDFSEGGTIGEKEFLAANAMG